MVCSTDSTGGSRGVPGVHRHPLFYSIIVFMAIIKSHLMVYNCYFKYIHSNHALQLKGCAMNNKL